ncbi:septum formation family protein [Streptomyces sp. NPDC093982]|uniref:septum formation family protein n=1 Tax=Streptomyces sp. NPDC093982 TaxID=3155077 RepID=UPI003442DE9E
MRTYPALLGVAGFLFLSGCGQSNTPAKGVPTDRQVVGTCHYVRTQEEFLQPSDVAPPVSCDQPHRTETIQLFTVDGQLAASKQRPEPEQLQEYANSRCNAEVLREYVGAGPRDSLAFSIWSKFPTRKEWARGVRTVRCDAGPPDHDPKVGPLVDFSIRDVMQSAKSAAVRNCERNGKVVTCDRPHDREEVNAWLPLPQGPYPNTIQTAATQVCLPYVQEFLARKDAPDVVIKAKVPSRDEWAKSNRTVKCGVGPADPRATVTGTLSSFAEGQ